MPGRSFAARRAPSSSAAHTMYMGAAWLAGSHPVTSPTPSSRTAARTAQCSGGSSGETP